MVPWALPELGARPCHLGPVHQHFRTGKGVDSSRSGRGTRVWEPFHRREHRLTSVHTGHRLLSPCTSSLTRGPHLRAGRVQSQTWCPCSFKMLRSWPSVWAHSRTPLVFQAVCLWRDLSRNVRAGRDFRISSPAFHRSTVSSFAQVTLHRTQLFSYPRPPSLDSRRLSYSQR